MRALLLATLLLVLAGVSALMVLQGTWSCHDLKRGIEAAEARQPVDALLHWRRSVQRLAPGLDCGREAALLTVDLAEQAEAAGSNEVATLAWQGLSFSLEAVHPARPGLRPLRERAPAEADRLRAVRVPDGSASAAEPLPQRRRAEALLASLLFWFWLAACFWTAWQGLTAGGSPRWRPMAVGLAVQASLLAAWLLLVANLPGPPGPG